MKIIYFYRDVRGFAIKFYSDDGIWDLLGIQTPTFFIRDPMLLPLFAHATKKNPVTNIKVRIIFGEQLRNIHFLKQTLTERPFLLFSVHRVQNHDCYYKHTYCQKLKALQTLNWKKSRITFHCICCI